MADLAARLSAALEGRYRVEREVGEGGMATVFLATDIRHDRRVALKVIRAEVAELLGPERFLREIRIAARLDHPNILALYDSGDAGGLLYYVMPYVDGESLRDRMTREGQLPIGDALRLAAQVADALAYAHKQGVVHRDIKPENILLSGGHAKLADFGIALAADPTHAKLTQTGLAIGCSHAGVARFTEAPVHRFRGFEIIFNDEDPHVSPLCSAPDYPDIFNGRKMVRPAR